MINSRNIAGLTCGAVRISGETWEKADSRYLEVAEEGWGNWGKDGRREEDEERGGEGVEGWWDKESRDLENRCSYSFVSSSLKRG